MATTTNYGWTTPDDTALVKDGAAAIRTLGSSVDTTTKNLNPETTLGDLAYRSSTANVKTRLGLGTANQILRVNSGATAPEWATVSSGSLTLLSTTTLSGASTTVSSISQDYETLYIIVNGMTVSSGTNAFRFSTNSSTNLLSDYKIDAGAISREFLVSYIQLDDGAQDLGNNTNNVFVITIDNYSSTAMFKTFNIYGLYNGTSSNGRIVRAFGGIASNTAINSITAATAGVSYNAGTIKIYGVK